MSITDSAIVSVAAQLGLSILTLSMALVLYRIMRGPKNADRIIALDLLSILVVALVTLFAIFSKEAAFLDVAFAYALVAFLGTAAFARYLERSAAAVAANSMDSPKGKEHD